MSDTCKHDGFSHTKNLSCPRDACKRCNGMQAVGFDVDRLRKIDEDFIAAAPGTPWPGCGDCMGLAAQNIIDSVYRHLREVPTDALMRELARRFL